MDPKNKFAAETVRKLQQSLDDVAPHQATELSKQQAIGMLSPQIVALRSKGYSWTAVAAMLSEHGVPVSVAALRTYLRRVREQAAHEVRRTPPKRLRDGRADALPPERPPLVVPLPSQGAETSPASKPLQPGAAPASAGAVRHAAAAAPSREQPSPRSAFTVRPDTENI
jgi:hypothetical protein